MRVITNAFKGELPGREAEVVPQQAKHFSDKAVDNRPEYEATCNNCLSQFAFRRLDPEVITTNEMEFIVECPCCKTELSIGEVTGIVRTKR